MKTLEIDFHFQLTFITFSVLSLLFLYIFPGESFHSARMGFSSLSSLTTYHQDISSNSERRDFDFCEK